MCVSAKSKVRYLASLCVRSWWLYKDGSSSSVLQILIYCAMYWVLFHFPFRSLIHTLYLKYMESNTIKMNALWLGLYRITVSKIFSDNDFAKDGVRGVQSKSFYYRCIYIYIYIYINTWNDLPKEVVSAASIQPFKWGLDQAFSTFWSTIFITYIRSLRRPWIGMRNVTHKSNKKQWNLVKADAIDGSMLTRALSNK